MKLLYLIFIMIFSFSNYLHPDIKISWQNLIAEFKDCQMIDSTNYVVVGNDGKVIISSDKGQTWNWIETGARVNLYSVFFLSKEIGSVAGDSGLIALTSNGGKTWSISHLDIDTINAIQIIDEHLLFVAGSKGSILRSYDFGNNWIKIYFDALTTINDIYFYNDSIGFAITTTGLILKTKNNGNNWEIIENKNKNIILNDIDFIGGHGVVAGVDTTEGNYHSIVTFSSDSGRSWTDLNCPLKTFINSVKIFNDSNIHIIGFSGGYAFTSNKGNSWKIDTLDSKTYFYQPEKLSVVAISANNDGNILAVGRENVIAFSSDFGRNYRILRWAPTFYLQRGKDINNLIFSDNKKIYAFGEFSQVFQSLDNGCTWNLVFPIDTIENDGDKDLYANMRISGAGMYDGNFSDPQNGFIVGRQWGVPIKGTTIYTNDSGYSWRIENKIAAISVSFINNKIGFAVHDSVLYRTSDGGFNWTRDTLVHGEYEFFNKIDFKTDSIGYIISVGLKVNKLYKSIDGGKSFNEKLNISNVDRNLSKMNWFDENTGYLFGYTKVIMNTNDGADTWNDVIFPLWHYIYDFIFIDSTKILACGINDSLYYSSDSGESWRIETLKISKRSSLENPSLFYNFKRSKTDDIFLVGRGRLLKVIVNDSSKIDFIETDFISSDRLYITVSPHPVKQFMNVKIYGLCAVCDENIFCGLFDLSGKMILNLSEETIRNRNGSITEFDIDTYGLIPGIYFIQLESGASIKSKKFMIIK